MGKSLAEQAIEQSIVEESKQRASRGGSHTLAQHALDQEAREIVDKRRQARADRLPERPFCAWCGGTCHCETD